jgi:hypothetical protein
VNPSDAILKTFVKSEKLNLNLKPDPVPRVIQPRDPRYNVEVGRFLKPLEHKLYDAIDELFDAPTVFSSYNAFTQARLIKEKWDSFASPVCVGLDASRFDQHVSKQALQFEHRLYDLVFHNARLRKLLGWQLANRGVARASDGWFRYAKIGGRASGDMNTSMGNKLLMCLMSKSYIDSQPFRIEFVNNGDDCLMILETKDLNKLGGLSSWFRDFGFKLTLEEPVFEFEQVEFCQTKPVCANGSWRMVRNVRTALSKDVTVVNLGHRHDQYRSRLYDIGMCGLATCADIPVMGEFYRMLVRLGVPGAYSKWDYEQFDYYYVSSRNAKCAHDRPDDFGRYSFWLSTGILPDAQVAIESYFSESVWGADNRQIIESLLISELLTQ